MTDVDVQTEQTEQVVASTPRPPSRRAVHRLARTALAGTLGGGILIALAAAAHVWFAPFVVGAAIGAVAGMRRVRARSAVLSAVVAAVGGWAAPLLWRTIAGEPVIGTARVVAALAGLPTTWSQWPTPPPSLASNSPATIASTGWLVIDVCLLVAAGQGLLGLWWARSLTGVLVARQHREKTWAADVVRRLRRLAVPDDSGRPA